jgi:hypothetical protein
VLDDPVHNGILRKESYDLHPPSALRAEHRVLFIDFADYLGPALGRDTIVLDLLSKAVAQYASKIISYIIGGIVQTRIAPRGRRME